MTWPLLHGVDGDGVAFLHQAFGVEIDDELNGAELLRFAVPLTDPKRAHLLDGVEVSYLGRRYRIASQAETHGDSGGEHVVECEALFAELGDTTDPTLPRLVLRTVESGLATLLAPTRWTVGGVSGTTGTYRSFPDDVSGNTILANVRSWALLFDAEIVWDTEARTVSFVYRRGQTRGAMYRHGKNLTEATRTTTPPQVTRIYPHGKDGLGIEPVNGGVGYVEDFGYYTALGLTLGEAQDRYLKQQVWNDDRYLDAAHLKAAAVERLAVLGYPQTSYDCRVQALDGDGETVGLGDTVTVTDEVLGVDVQTRVVRLRRFPLDPTRDEVTLGSAEPASWQSSAGSAGGSENLIQRPFAVVIAAADSPDEAKRVADFVCPGANDEETIAEALNAAAASFGATVFREGTYHIDHPFDPPDWVDVRGAPGVQWLVKNGVDLTFGLFRCSDVVISYVGETPPYWSTIALSTGTLTRVYSNDHYPHAQLVVAGQGSDDFAVVIDQCFLGRLWVSGSSLAVTATAVGTLIADYSRVFIGNGSTVNTVEMYGCTESVLDTLSAYSIDLSDAIDGTPTTDTRVFGPPRTSGGDVRLNGTTTRATVFSDGADVTVAAGAVDTTIIGRPASITDAGTGTRVIDGAAGGASLADLLDVDDTLSPADGDVLTYDIGAGEWTAASPIGGGGGGSVAAVDVTDDPTGRSMLTNTNVDANLDAADAAFAFLQGLVGLVGGTSAASADADYTLVLPVRLVTMTGLTAARTVTLPAAADLAGTSLTITVRCDATCSATETVTITPDGTDTINGAATLVLDTANAAARLVVDPAGGNWLTV